jgi:hypothetical protein
VRDAARMEPERKGRRLSFFLLPSLPWQKPKEIITVLRLGLEKAE